jgi:predicted ABC-type exoprotein transport system permease subunit
MKEKNNMKQYFKTQLLYSLVTTIFFWLVTLVVYLYGYNPLELPPMIIGDILLPIITLKLFIDYKTA